MEINKDLCFLFNQKSNPDEYTYQKELTAELDNTIGDFDQDIVNKIVLWKVNRYSSFKEEEIAVLNEISSDETVLDKDKTIKILSMLLNIKGVQLPMASTILRFKNKHIYQIIDQRVFRILNDGTELGSILKNHKPIEYKIDLYLKYLEDLHQFCRLYDIEYSNSDRIIYMADKVYNKGKNLSNHGSKLK